MGSVAGGREVSVTTVVRDSATQAGERGGQSGKRHDESFLVSFVCVVWKGDNYESTRQEDLYL